MKDKTIMRKIGYISRMMRLLAVDKETAEKLQSILEDATYKDGFRDFNEQEVAYIKELVKQYKEKTGTSIVDDVVKVLGAEARAYLRDFEVV